MTIDDLKAQNLILLECISGSRAYGLDLPHSDTDIRGVFYLPRDQFYGFQYVPQVSNATNDIVYYELGRLFELMAKNNPNILELLATPSDKVLYQHPLIDEIDLRLFLSKRCKDTFGGYAFTQIRKARGLNKKIVNPIPKEKKTILDFCYILDEQGSLSLTDWLSRRAVDQSQCGVAKIPHARDMYGLYVDELGTFSYRGLLKKENATALGLSSIPKGERPAAYLSFNQDGFAKYCQDYRAYWDWVENRNEERYLNNVEHGKNYDSKNLMHTFRLLEMAKEILKEGKVKVHRTDREALLKIRRGEFEYDELIERAEQKMAEIEVAYQHSPLPDQPDQAAIESLLIRLRTHLYHTS